MKRQLATPHTEQLGEEHFGRGGGFGYTRVLEFLGSIPDDPAGAARAGLHTLSGGSSGFGGKAVGPLLSGQRLRELFEVTSQGALEVVGGQADTVVGNAALREIVGADLRRAVTRADLG